MFFLGLYDALSQNKAIMNILYTHLPTVTFKKIQRYLSFEKKVQSCLDWNLLKAEINTLNFDECARKLIIELQNHCVNDNNVKIFHISSNEHNVKGVEPTSKKITQMIYKFLCYIYKRNILASLIKYILLKSLLDKMETFHQKKLGIVQIIHTRLKAFIFECILTSFNGSNYDNYLLCNSLMIIQSKLREKMIVYKKGASLTTIHILIKKNMKNAMPMFSYKNKHKKFPSNLWTMHLYIKDVRNLVASNMSLDKIGTLFNLPISKLCFPYNQATSIKRLKYLKSLHPNDDTFWKDTFSNKKVSLEQRQLAEQLFHEKKFKNLYDYNAYYLMQDCCLLHAIVLTLFRNYLSENINIVIRKNFSQSSLAFETFFISDPSRQIIVQNSPKTINNTFINYFIRNSVTGGFCTTFVHGTINSETLINEHLKYVEAPFSIDKNIWPSLVNLQNNWKTVFNNKPSGIMTIDIRSLYPSAACKKIPVGNPYLYSRLTENDFHKNHENFLFSYNINNFCQAVREKNTPQHDFFKLLNKPLIWKSEFYAISNYLRQFQNNKNIKILRFQSNFTAFGQLYLGNIPVDGFLSFQDLVTKKIHLKIIQYNSTYCHGHRSTCKVSNTGDLISKAEHTLHIKNQICNFLENLQAHFNLQNVDFEYIDIYDCDFFLHKIPFDRNKPKFQNQYSYDNFLSKIYNKKLTGFVVVKDLEINDNAKNPIFGFIIQKADFEFSKLSPYTQQHLQMFTKNCKVIGLHKSKSFMIISTEYLLWLENTFGFKSPPDIYHALLFEYEYYLRNNIESKLLQRKHLKEQIKIERNPFLRQNMEVKSELIKLMLNSCYGFTLCNIGSEKFKTLKLVSKLPRKHKRSHVISSIQIDKTTFILESTNKNLYQFQTLLGHIGSTILFNSKIILLKRLYFLLKYLDPSKAQLLYMDTDSAHFLLQHKTFVENVNENLKISFQYLYNKHFETGNKISGIWVIEGFFETGEYLGEKCYVLSTINDHKVIHMKGLNPFLQQKYISENINVKNTSCISYNMFYKSPDFVLFKTHMSKDLFSNFIPYKRYFVSSTGSLPLKL